MLISVANWPTTRSLIGPISRCWLTGKIGGFVPLIFCRQCNCADFHLTPISLVDSIVGSPNGISTLVIVPTCKPIAETKSAPKVNKIDWMLFIAIFNCVNKLTIDFLPIDFHRFMVSIGQTILWADFSCVIQKSRVLFVCDLVFTDVILIGDMTVTIKVGLIPSIPNMHHFNWDCFFLAWWRRKLPDIASDDFSVLFDWINAPVVYFTRHKRAVRCEDVICLLRL